MSFKASDEGLESAVLGFLSFYPHYPAYHRYHWLHRVVNDLQWYSLNAVL